MITESKLQADCYIWFHNTFPKLRGLLCYNLNNSKNKIDGNRNKAMGLQKGRADMTFYFEGRAYFFEFKVDTGKQSPDQVEWERKVTEHGFSYSIIRSFAQFQERLHEVIAPKMSVIGAYPYNGSNGIMICCRSCGKDIEETDGGFYPPLQFENERFERKCFQCRSM